jgi:hypothetical protein
VSKIYAQIRTVLNIIISQSLANSYQPLASAKRSESPLSIKPLPLIEEEELPH